MNIKKIFCQIGLVILSSGLIFTNAYSAGKYEKFREENQSSYEFPSSPFGVAFGEGYHGEIFMDDIRNLGVRRTKISLRWNEIEPGPGVYRWKKVDAYVNQLKDGDKALLNVFTVGWGTNNESYKGATLKNEECKRLYREFIVKLVKRTKGKITYWQRDTEPASPRHWPADKAKEYVETQKIFYQAVKSVQPDAIVVGVNANGSFNKMGQHSYSFFFNYIIKNMRDYYDVLDIRLYEDLYTIQDRVSWFRNKMRQYGYEKPIVCTEFGGPDPRALSGKPFQKLLKKIRDACGKTSNPEGFFRCARNWMKSHRDEIDPRLKMFFPSATPDQEAKREKIHCHDIVQRHIVAYSSGVKASWWWNLQSAGKDLIFGKMRLMEFPDTKFPSYYCFKRMVSKLGNISSIQKIGLPDESIHFYRIKRADNTTIYVAWHREKGVDFYNAEEAPPVMVSFKVGFKRAKITDIFGNEKTELTKNGILKLNLSDTPVYIEEEI